MLTYHPALDAYHCSLRILRLLAFAPEHKLELARLRILDFYLTFPMFIRNLSLPPRLAKSKNQFSQQSTKYRASGFPPSILRQMVPLQDVAISQLKAKGLIEHEDQDVLRLRDADVPPSLRDLSATRNSENNPLMKFLVEELREIPLMGTDGLKRRSGLLEHRYDPV